MKLWPWDEKNLPWITHAIRTALLRPRQLSSRGLLSFAFRLEKTAYRYASITLTIIVLIPRSYAPWSVALHRFLEVSIGIIVALTVVALWPEHQRLSPDSTAE